MANQERTYEGFGGRVGRTFSASRPWWKPQPRRLEGAPNVIVMLVDDMGFSDIGCYGSEIETPTLDAMAAGGVRYRNFHVTPLCSPTRAALLTGLNPHDAGVGYLVSGDTGFPGYQGSMDPRAVTLAEQLRGHGYTTLMVGKWHLTSAEDLSEASPKSSWPLQRGFDRYYGFLEAGLTNLHHPNRLCEDNHVVHVDRYPDGYYFTDDITDHAIDMIRGVKGADPEQPFFLYFAHGAVHAPLHAKPADMAKYRGRYAAGWDRMREERFARQKELGIVPQDAVLPQRNQEPLFDAPAWDSLTPKEQELFARHMEAYAAMVDNIDQNLGRLRAALEELGELDNTIIIFTSDNGGSREGGSRGSTEYFRTVAAAFTNLEDEDRVEIDYERIDLIGGPRLMTHYPRGWSMVSNTPFRLYKGTTYAGGHQVPCVISWPAGLPEKGVIRPQYTHVTDLVPTLLDLIGRQPLTERHGLPAKELTGASMRPTLADGDVPTPHPEQYYEIAGHRGFHRDGWEAVTLHYPRGNFDEEPWQLFHVAADPTQTTDLAAKEPQRRDELVEAFDEAAWRFHVYPLDDQTGLHMMRSPDLDRPVRAVTLHRAAKTLERQRSTRLVAGRSFTVTVRLEFRPGDRGILVAHGDQGGGYALYVDDDELRLAYNFHSNMHELVGGRLPTGPQEVIAELTAPGGGVWDVAFVVGGERSASQTLPMLSGLSPFEGIDVGIDRRSPVSWELYEREGCFPYTGALSSVTYEPGELAPDAVARMILERREALLKAQ